MSPTQTKKFDRLNQLDSQQMNPETDLEREMRRMGDTESSIAYWATREVLWNGNPVTVRKPARNWPNENTGD